MKQILYLTWDDISKPTCGCAQRSAFLCEALRKIGDVDVVQLRREMVRETALATLFRKISKVALWPWGRPGIEINRNTIKSKKYDIVVCRYLMTAAITQAWKIAPCYVDIDDMPSEAFASVEGKRLPPILRPLGAVLVNLWLRYCLGKCPGAWTVSDTQVQFVREIGIKNVRVLPNLARRPGPNYNVNAHQERLLMTVGLMGYGPNQEGVDWFLTTIWPEVHERWPDLTYAIAGGGLAENIQSKWAALPNVHVMGFVDDIDSLYARSLAVVAPILSGAGTCIKVVEAGLHGRYVLATPKATRGHDDLIPLGGIKVFEDCDGFCKMLETIMRSDLATEQPILSKETARINSIEKFDKAVEDLLTS